MPPARVACQAGARALRYNTALPMSVAVAAGRAPARVTFPWILGPGRDLVFYIGSALAGWVYVGVILYALYTLEDPLRQPLAVLTAGPVSIALTLHLLVLVSWALLLDAPHVWATLARTLFDPDEWRVRGGELRRSFLWFLLGPTAILLPYVLVATTAPLGAAWPAGSAALGAVAFFVFFRLWAYYHVVRQHWGFFSLYKRKAGDYGPAVDRLDYWFFHVTLFGPLVLFMTGPVYASAPGYPDLGLQRALIGGWSLADVVHPGGWAVYLAVVLTYAGTQLRRWWAGAALNGSKLLYMSLVVPLHLVAFSHPMMIVFLVPLVTVGHNIQYHCIVYSYGRSKYGAHPSREYRWARGLFRNVAVYAVTGLAFTLLLYRGPWIDWLGRGLGLRLNELFLNSLGMMAGVANPAALGLGEQLFAAFLLGFAMQHYYLDAKIWRVSRDRDVRQHLKV
jgi:hypothetical protein